MSGLTELHDQGGLTWTERERGWMAAPHEVLSAAIWVSRAMQDRALVFIEIDGELIKVDHRDVRRLDETSRDEGGES